MKEFGLQKKKMIDNKNIATTLKQIGLQVGNEIEIISAFYDTEKEKGK